METVGVDVVNTILLDLEKNLGLFGYEFYPFKIGWYNSLVQPIFRLDCSDDTLAFLIISSPQMFERAFLPFVHQKYKHLSDMRDPIDECLVFYMSKIKHIFPKLNINIIHDFEIHENRRPKFIFQSAAHACGAAYFYHERDLEESSYNELNCNGKKLYGVCIHPKYGGWFALRAVAIMTNIQCPSLSKTLPMDVVPHQQDRKLLLELYNFHWKDWKFRDIIPVKEKYSDLQIRYFSTPPGQRQKIIPEILHNHVTFSS